MGSLPPKRGGGVGRPVLLAHIHRFPAPNDVDERPATITRWLFLRSVRRRCLQTCVDDGTVNRACPKCILLSMMCAEMPFVMDRIRCMIPHIMRQQNMCRC